MLAIKEMGLDYQKWRDGEYSKEVMEEVRAFYDLKTLVEAHTKDAEAQEMERRSRKKK